MPRHARLFAGVERHGGVEPVRSCKQRGCECHIVRRLCRGAQRAGRVLRRSFLGVDAAVGAGGCELGGRASCAAAAAAARLEHPLADALGGHQRLKHVSLVSSHRRPERGGALRSHVSRWG